LILILKQDDEKEALFDFTKDDSLSHSLTIMGIAGMTAQK
jgi:hypothetical protein